jgi:2-polyprenyl-6-methoxyphenol hydroxylase-like FAD-dependent oxidoreductase
VRITGLRGGPAVIAGVPHVTGVQTSAGEELRADLVIDAMGRRSAAAQLLTALGGRAPQAESEDCGFVYYTRYFSGPVLPPRIGPPIMPIGTITVLTLPGDNGTWSVTVFAASGDAPLKELRDADTFTRVVRACPLQAHWLDGEPVTGVLPMAGIMDSYRRFAADGTPIVTGFAAVGDAWACTNPSAGRGVSVGALHAQLLRATVQDHFGDPAEFARVWDERTVTEMAPYYWNQIRADRVRLAEMAALRDGREPAPDDSLAAQLGIAAMSDPDVFRAFLEVALCLALPQDVLARPGMREKVERAGREPQRPAPGPDRQQLLRLLATP